MRKRIPILILGGLSLVASLFVVGISAKLYLHHLAVKKGVGPLHIFQLSEKPECLTQELALAKAREAIKLDGDDPASWNPIRDPEYYLASRGYGLASLFDGIATRDARTNEFLSLESKRPGCGIVIFVDDKEAVRFVRVGLSGSNVLCQSSHER
jgi:hypothetical protein